MIRLILNSPCRFLTPHTSEPRQGPRYHHQAEHAPHPCAFANAHDHTEFAQPSHLTNGSTDRKGLYMTDFADNLEVHVAIVANTKSGVKRLRRLRLRGITLCMSGGRRPQAEAYWQAPLASRPLDAPVGPHPSEQHNPSLPLKVELPMGGRAIPKVKVDEALVRDTDFL